MTACDVRSPSTPRSSSRATATASRAADRRRRRRRSPRCRLLCGERHEAPLRGRRPKTNRPRKSDEDSGKSRRVCVPRDSVRARGRVHERAAHRDEVPHFGVGRTRHGCELRGSTLEAGGVAEHARLAGHEPLDSSRATGVSARVAGNGAGRMRLDASQHAGLVGLVLPACDGVDVRARRTRARRAASSTRAGSRRARPSTRLRRTPTARAGRSAPSRSVQTPPHR